MKKQPGIIEKYPFEDTNNSLLPTTQLNSACPETRIGLKTSADQRFCFAGPVARAVPNNEQGQQGSGKVRGTNNDSLMIQIKRYQSDVITHLQKRWLAERSKNGGENLKRGEETWHRRWARQLRTRGEAISSFAGHLKQANLALQP